MFRHKTLLIIPILIITILASFLTPVYANAQDSNYEPRLTAPNSSIEYYNSSKNVYFQTGYGMPNCVAYAYGRVYEMNGEKPKIDRGNAGEWYYINQANGYYDYGQEPKVGSIACWSNHVAIVEEVNSNGVTISESHWGGEYFDIRTYADMSSHFGQTFYGYIYTYNGGMTDELEERLVNAKPEAEKVEFGKTEEVKPVNDLLEINSNVTLIHRATLNTITEDSTKVEFPLMVK